MKDWQGAVRTREGNNRNREQVAQSISSSSDWNNDKIKDRLGF
jgi:hypothetical protein